ncbi:hypothetical protein BDV95DRAFT_480721 [Massariosphaeria phaeospora]|uniref:DUF1746 domain-containing protein n=1 Tax=Massariosphaeria phaeospora TaxID=100035 RepID=A0A7C8MJP5_9PLEO|nr:hypothetical protein BDV95DRAFT_480721 [Massariosphaeria phaeospora]
MDDEAESSRAGPHGSSLLSDADATADERVDEIDEEDEVHARDKIAKTRRVDAKRKRVLFLDLLLRELDYLVFLELVTLYYLDCSFFWFFVRAVIHAALLTPLPDFALNRQHDEHKPFLPLILFAFTINFLLHLLYPEPAAGEDTRGYLHGGLMIDFIGQQGPTSKWKLVALDICILVLQLTMVSVHVKRRDLKKRIAKISGGGSESRSAEGEQSNTGEHAEPPMTNMDRDQDADSEERGVLRRTDTMSDAGADQDEEDTLLPSTTESGHADALDLLSSGQGVVGDFTLIDTLLQEHENYQVFRRSETGAGASASTSLSPSTLHQLHTLRMRFGVGGG